MLSLAPLHRGGDKWVSPGQQERAAKPQATSTAGPSRPGGPRRHRRFVPGIPLTAGGDIYQLYYLIYPLYQLDGSKLGPEGRNPPRAGASGRRAGARGSPTEACAQASARQPRRALTLATSSWAPRGSAPRFRCLVFPL